jgi:hypothetical protein
MTIFRESCMANRMASGFKLLRGIERPNWGNRFWWGRATQFVPKAFERCSPCYEWSYLAAFARSNFHGFGVGNLEAASAGTTN